MNRLMGLFAALLLMAGVTHASAAEFFGSVEPNDVLRMLQENGYEDAHVSATDNEDLPILKFKMGRSDAVIYFYECGRTGRQCEFLQLYVGWAMDKRPSYKAINDFNAAERYSQAYIDDEDDPVIEQWVTLEGGISDVNFITTVAMFEDVVEKFEDLIGWTGNR